LATPSTVAATSSLVAGVRVSNDADASAGNGSVSSPYADWMLFEPFVHDFAGVADPSGDSPLSGRLIDVKSMRKVEEINEQLTLWLESTLETYRFTSYLSVLLKLP